MNCVHMAVMTELDLWRCRSLFWQYQMFIVANMRPAVQPCSAAAYTPLESLGLFPTCVNTSHVDNFLMFATYVNQLILDITLNGLS